MIPMISAVAMEVMVTLPEIAPLASTEKGGNLIARPPIPEMRMEATTNKALNSPKES